MLQGQKRNLGVETGGLQRWVGITGPRRPLACLLWSVERQCGKQLHCHNIARYGREAGIRGQVTAVNERLASPGHGEEAWRGFGPGAGS